MVFVYICLLGGLDYSFFVLRIQIKRLTLLFDSGTNIGRIDEDSRIHEDRFGYSPKLTALTIRPGSLPLNGSNSKIDFFLLLS